MKNHNWIAVVAGISIIFTFMTVTALVCSVETEGIHESLRGIKELGLAVISDPDQARIPTVQLRRDIELKLATPGIRVLPSFPPRKDRHIKIQAYEDHWVSLLDAVGGVLPTGFVSSKSYCQNTGTHLVGYIRPRPNTKG
jgi:hypothetical protein